MSKDKLKERINSIVEMKDATETILKEGEGKITHQEFYDICDSYDQGVACGLLPEVEDYELYLAARDYACVLVLWECRFIKEVVDTPVGMNLIKEIFTFTINKFFPQDRCMYRH